MSIRRPYNPSPRSQPSRHSLPALFIPRWLACSIILSAFLLIGPSGYLPRANADGPGQNSAFVPPAPTVTNRAVCIDPGEDRECFTLDDLQKRAPKWTITPPVWKDYPAALDDIPLVQRTYADETIEYLAAHEVRYGDRESGAIALTFDCELNPRRTMLILDTLRRESVTATFFVQGRFAYRYPDVIRRMVADGHELGSHSFFHPLFTDITPVSMTQEITYTEAAIAWAVGEYVPMRYFRFPYAGRNNATRRHVAALGYQSSSWDIDPRGWDPQKTAQDVVDHVKKLAHAGGTIIMHCNSADDLHALPEVFRVVRELGLEPGTVTAVLTPEDRDVPGYQLLPDP